MVLHRRREALWRDGILVRRRKASFWNRSAAVTIELRESLDQPSVLWGQPCRLIGTARRSVTPLSKRLHTGTTLAFPVGYKWKHTHGMNSQSLIKTDRTVRFFAFLLRKGTS